MTSAGDRVFAAYRLRAADGSLLYAGCTGQLEQRVAAHRRKAWGPLIASVEAKTFATRAEAADEELVALSTEAPRYNRRFSRETRSEESWSRPRPRLDVGARAILSVPEVARRIGVSKNTLYRTIYETGEVLPGVPAFKVRSSWRVSTQVLDRFLEAGDGTAHREGRAG